jgi:hypothetical protein
MPNATGALAGGFLRDTGWCVSRSLAKFNFVVCEELVDVLNGDEGRGAFELGIGGEAPGGRDATEEVRDGDEAE